MVISTVHQPSVLFQKRLEKFLFFGTEKSLQTIKASDLLEHQSTVCQVPYA